MSEDQRLQDVLETLYGDGAWVISKELTKQQKRQRTEARIGLTSNIVGTTAGLVATKQAYDEFSRARGRYAPRHVKIKTPKIPRIPAKYAVPAAGAALGLQIANNVGDVIANKVLARESAKGVKKKEIHKADSLNPRDMKLKMVKTGVNATGTALKKAPATAASTANAGAKVVKWSGKQLAKVEMPADPQHVVTVKKDVDFAIRGEISKMNEEKQQVFGWASVIEVNGEPVIDLQGDIMTIETIEKAAYDYVHKSRKGGRQHQRNGMEPLHVSDMIESFVLTPEKKEKMGLPETTPTGWWVGFQVNDDDTWQAYKDGKLKEFSIHGSGTRKALEV